MSGQREWTRRGAIKLVWTGVLAVGALSFQPLAEYLSSTEDQVRSPLVNYAQSPVKNAAWLHVPDSRVWLRQDSRGIMAVLATCTHLGCEVTYDPAKNEWHCPCHGSVYDPEGRPIAGPAPKALPRVAVERKANGSLLINTAATVGMEARA